jgi:murein DD-endopeptidase MepM/ murein hydrolase activator NlpD
MNKYFLGVLALIFVSAGVYVGMTKIYPETDVTVQDKQVAAVEIPVVKYGLKLNGFTLLSNAVKPNQFFADILTSHNVAYSSIDFLVRESKKIFNLNKIRAGNNYTVVCQQTDSGLVACKLIYEENKVDYVVFNLEDSLYIYRGQHPVERKHHEVSGIIKSSLYETMDNYNLNNVLAVRMADIFAWSIDFYKIQPGDKFKVIYDEDFVDGKSIAIGEIQAVVFNSGGKDFYAFYYEKDNSHEGDYYDENGNSMKKMFLKAPVKFSRISSKFSMKRFHPVTKAWKAHLGTDYAASYGTPIIATADGIVEEAQFKVFNGNYVKIRHSGQYKTQYLHMSKIAKGVRSGRAVKQGEVIGYVGSTGLATGPHVCYRFWKDGQQVDPLKQKLTFAEPLPAKYKQDFLSKSASTKTAIDNISYDKPATTTVVAQNTKRLNEGDF